jgi:hypothetical protein
MPKSPAKKIPMEARRLKVEELFSRGMSLSHISIELGVPKSQVTRDFQHIRQQRQDIYAEDLNLARQEELARIAQIQQKAWLAWDRSCQDAGPVKITWTIHGALPHARQGLAGDPRFLTILLDCVKQRRAILGLDSRKTIATGGQPFYKAYLFDPDNPPNPEDGRAA